MSDYLGIYQGSVVDNNDVLGIGRVTCLVPAVLGDQASNWCAPIYPTVYRPNVNDIVWVQFVNGDPAKPIYFSSDEITAEKIVAGSITAEALSADAIDGKTITGVTITGGTLQTVEAPNSGIKIFGNSLDVYDSSGNRTLSVDGSQGDITVVGEFGTSLPGSAGVHIAAPGFTGYYGKGTTYFPTVEFNNGVTASGYRQPQIWSDTAGTANLYMWSGASATNKMGLVKLDAARARIGVEFTAGSEETDGGSIDITPSLVTIYSTQPVQVIDANQPTSYQDIIMSNATVTGDANITGDANVTGNVYASAAVRCNGSFQTSASGFQMVNNAQSSFKPVAASAFNVSSDRAIKSGIKEPSIDALSTIRNLPVYEYTLRDHDRPTLGIMADDAPEVLVGSGALATTDGTQVVDVKTVDLYALVATLIQAVHDLDVQLDDVIPERKAKKPVRKTRTL